MASLNKVMLIGNLGRNPEVSYTPGGMAVCNLSLATTDIWNDKASGQQRERTEWHKITFFGKSAETIGQYMRKGKQMYVEGRLQTDSYEKDGITRYLTKIIGSQFQFLGNREQGQQQGDSFQSGYQQQSPQQQQNNGTFQPQPDQDDDIPF